LVSDLLAGIPPILIFILIALIAFFISGKRLGLAAFAVFGLWLIDNQGLWSQFIDTFKLVLIASLLSVIIGVPLGILMAKSKIAETIITPILDFIRSEV